MFPQIAKFYNYNPSGS